MASLAQTLANGFVNTAPLTHCGLIVFALVGCNTMVTYLVHSCEKKAPDFMFAARVILFPL